MATIDLTEVPSTLSMTLMGNTGVYQSPLNGSAQTIDRGGLKWRAQYNYTNISKDRRARLMAIMARLRSQANRIRVSVYDNPKRGAYGGTPLVMGASQTGSSIDLDGLSNNITNWIRAGDYFSIDVNGEHELKMCTEDASSNGSGEITINFEPRLRESPLDNAAVFVEDGVLSKPQGVFLAQGSDLSWTSRPFQTASELSSITLTLMEDVFATQS